MIPRYTRAEMAAVWSEEARLGHWFQVELLAVEAWAKLGVVPAQDLAAIQERAVVPSPARVAEIERVTEHDVAAFVQAMAEPAGEAGRWIHYGLTSSDVIDTALALQLREALDLVLDQLEELLVVVKRRALEHRDTVCIARTHGIHAEPTTFGHKLAGWAFEL